MRLFPSSVSFGRKWVADVHRHLPRVQGAKWCIGLRTDDDDVIGVALVGHGARALGPDTLTVTRVAVLEGYKNACSMLYGACSRAAKAMGADDLITYTTLDEPGTSLRATGWVCAGMTRGGSWDTPSRRRSAPIDPRPKHRWLAPWGIKAKQIKGHGVDL